MLKSEDVKRKLNNAINTIVENKEKYVADPKRDFTRKRKLPMDKTISSILLMQGGSLNSEIRRYCKANSIELSPSAFVQQRQKIKADAFYQLFRCFDSYCDHPKSFKGYRLFAIDGSDINVFRNPEEKSFIYSKTYPKGYNLLHLNALYDLQNKMFFDCIIEPKSICNEQLALQKMLNRNTFLQKCIILMDRGYDGYNLMAHLLNTPNVDFICRTRHGKAAYRAIRDFPMIELDVEITETITITQTNDDKINNRCYIQTKKNSNRKYSDKTSITLWDFPSPYTIKFRVVRFQLPTGEYETIVTSLPKNRFSIAEIKQLYHLRWGIETSFKDIKYTCGIMHLHSKIEELARQEIFAAITMYNLCSVLSVMSEAQVDNKRKYSYRINFSMAMRICKEFLLFNKSLKTILTEILKYQNPIRPGRHDERNGKLKGFIGFSYRIPA